MDDINSRNLFLTVLEAGKSKIKAPTGSVSGEDLLPRSKMTVSLLYPYIAEGIREFPKVTFIRTLISSMKALRS